MAIKRVVLSAPRAALHTEATLHVVPVTPKPVFFFIFEVNKQTNQQKIPHVVLQNVTSTGNKSVNIAEVFVGSWCTTGMF